MLGLVKAFHEKALSEARAKLYGGEDITWTEVKLICADVQRVEPGKCQCYSEFWQDLPQPGERCPVCKKIA